jgi:hypothetical protein
MAYKSSPIVVQHLFGDVDAPQIAISNRVPAFKLDLAWLHKELGYATTGIFELGTLSPSGATITAENSLISLQGNHTISPVDAPTYGTKSATFSGAGATIPGSFASTEPAALTIAANFQAPNPNDYATIMGTTSSADALGMNISWSAVNGPGCRAQPVGGFLPKLPMKSAIAPGDFITLAARRSASQFFGQCSIGVETQQTLTPALRPTTALRIGSVGYSAGSYANKPVTASALFFHLGTMSKSDVDLLNTWLSWRAFARALQAL